MDKYIEMFAPMLIDWQQTAIANTRYSVVLAALAFIIGCQLVVLWKRKGTADLKHQLMEEKQTLEQAEHKLKQAEQEHEELIVKQTTDAESLTELQQQLEQLSANMQESEEQHAEILQKHEQLNKTLDEKQSAMDALKLNLDDKTHVVEQIQGKLAEQKNLLAEYALDQAKIEELKKEAGEANSVKQQLLQRENENNEQIKKIEKLEQSAKNSIDRVLLLESQLEKQSHAGESEVPQEQLAQLESVKVQLDQEKRNADSKAEYSVELEHTLQQQNQQLAQFNEKLQTLLMQSPPQPIAQQNTSSGTDNKEAEGLFGKILKLVSKLDNVDISDHNQNDKKEEEPEDAWKKHQQIIDQLIEQSSIQTEDNEHQPIAVEIADSAVESPDVLAGDSQKQVNEVQANEVTEKTDNIQDKLKGFYHKFRS